MLFTSATYLYRYDTAVIEFYINGERVSNILDVGLLLNPYDVYDPKRWGLHKLKNPVDP